jgi:hypothetical protein
VAEIKSGDHEPQEPYIIITGNPVDGFSFQGPFSSRDDAIEHAERGKVDADWWVELISPA